MNEKITLHLFYTAVAAAIIALAAGCLVILGGVRQQARIRLDRQAAALGEAFDRYGPESLETLTPEGVYLSFRLPDGTSGTVGELPENRGVLTAQAALSGGGTLEAIAEAPDLDGSYGEIAVIVLAVAAMAAVAAAFRARAIVKPIRVLADSVDRDGAITAPYPEMEPLVRQLQSSRSSEQDMRQEFTANVTHELKTPLTTISGYAEMIANGMARPNDVKPFAEKIHAESSRMLMLVNDILELSRLDSGETLENPEPVDMLALSMECADQLSALAEKRGIQIHVSGSAMTVVGDERKLWEMLYNLMENAIRYNRENGRVDVVVSDRAVTVKDTGIGISPEHQKRIFERFYRVDKSHSRATGGTGLGLSIVKHVAEMHGGKISLKSALNAGTEITVNFT